MLNKFIEDLQIISISAGVMTIAIVITIIIALIVQAIVYRKTKISLYNMLMKSLLK